MLNTIASFFKHPLWLLVFFSVGFASGMYFQDQFGKPKTLQEIKIGKQKIKGQNNDGKFDNNINLESHDEKISNKEKRKTRRAIKRAIRNNSSGGDTISSARVRDSRNDGETASALRRIFQSEPKKKISLPEPGRQRLVFRQGASGEKFQELPCSKKSLRLKRREARKERRSQRKKERKAKRQNFK